ncbi:hypothetical protein [Paenibacillus sp. RC67]|uniref:hypothetical protein n=1 Tax=Paenibacillus sp. RC67 TaxID=3039392 RepID=UPI0024AE27FD|nr:hypothetical protein [Paenibacillus sp. RC67]
MLIQNQLLLEQVDFDNAMYWKVPVSVWRGNQVIDFGGFIKQHDDDAVCIASDYFSKKEFRFKVR